MTELDRDLEHFDSSSVSPYMLWSAWQANLRGLRNLGTQALHGFFGLEVYCIARA